MLFSCRPSQRASGRTTVHRIDAYIESMYLWDDGIVLDLAILGFLAEGPLPGHELRRRVSELTGYTRPVSDGSLYPAIKRLAAAGLLERRADPAAGAARYVLSVTDAGRTELLKRLRTPAG